MTGLESRVARSMRFIITWSHSCSQYSLIR